MIGLVITLSLLIARTISSRYWPSGVPFFSCFAAKSFSTAIIPSVKKAPLATSAPIIFANAALLSHMYFPASLSLFPSDANVPPALASFTTISLPSFRDAATSVSALLASDSGASLMASCSTSSISLASLMATSPSPSPKTTPSARPSLPATSRSSTMAPLILVVVMINCEGES
ncbi:hypothetical protein AA313_de0203821 [Arthrobotrys entomopaga]|nr:hypothetical protein AA313_de0203821 [Arthrobotrys entomopaga]